MNRDRFVGRREELGILVDAYDHVRRGAGGRMILVSGVAGIGKTALVRRMSERVDRRAVNVLAASCMDDIETPPLWPWLEMLPEIVDPLPGVEDDPLAAHVAYRLVREALETRLAERPLFIVIENLHVADDATLEVIELLSAAISDQQIASLLVLTAREWTGDSTRIGRTGDALRRSGACVELRLAPFGLDEMTALLESYRGRAVDIQEAAALRERSGGNPLYATEIARADVQVPQSIRDATAARISHLPDEARLLIGFAAVLGRPFTVPDLRPTATDDATILPAIDAAYRTGVLVDAGEDLFDFSHQIVREAVVALLTPAQRVDAHMTALRSIEAATSGPDERGEWVGEALRHAVASATSVGQSAVVRYALAAGRTAYAGRSFTASLRYFETGLDAVGPDASSDRGALLEGYANTLGFGLGVINPADLWMTRAFDCFAEIGDLVGMARTAAAPLHAEIGGPLRWGGSSRPPVRTAAVEVTVSRSDHVEPGSGYGVRGPQRGKPAADRGGGGNRTPGTNLERRANRSSTSACSWHLARSLRRVSPGRRAGVVPGRRG